MPKAVPAVRTLCNQCTRVCLNRRAYGRAFAFRRPRYSPRNFRCGESIKTLKLYTPCLESPCNWRINNRQVGRLSPAITTELITLCSIRTVINSCHRASMRQGPGFPGVIVTILMPGGELVRSNWAVRLFTEIKLALGIIGFEVTELLLDNRTPPPRGGIRRVRFRRQPPNSRVDLASQTQSGPFSAELEQKWLRTSSFTESKR